MCRAITNAGGTAKVLQFMEQLFDAILEIAGKNPDGFTVDLTRSQKVFLSLISKLRTVSVRRD